MVWWSFRWLRRSFSGLSGYASGFWDDIATCCNGFREMRSNDRQRREYSDEVRARCLAALNAGESPAAVSAQYNVTTATLRSWKARAAQVGATPLVSEEKRLRMGDLLADYVAEIVVSLRKQAVVGGDAEYLRKQSAADLAVLHREFGDRLIRILEALEQGANAESDTTGKAGGLMSVTASKAVVLLG
jgi:transposase-like protein